MSWTSWMRTNDGHKSPPAEDVGNDRSRFTAARRARSRIETPGASTEEGKYKRVQYVNIEGTKKLNEGHLIKIGIGVVNLEGGASSGVQSQQVFKMPPQRRTRVYWRQEGDN